MLHFEMKFCQFKLTTKKDFPLNLILQMLVCKKT